MLEKMTTQAERDVVGKSRMKCSGVLSNRKMPVKLKGTIITTVVRPAMLYGADTWAR